MFIFRCNCFFVSGGRIASFSRHTTSGLVNDEIASLIISWPCNVTHLNGNPFIWKRINETRPASNGFVRFKKFTVDNHETRVSEMRI